MTAPRTPDQLLNAFLDEGLTELPDRVYEAVRRDIHRSRQRVVLGPWREPQMATLRRLAVAAVVVVAVGIAWTNLVPTGFGPAAPSPTPSAPPTLIPGDAPLPPGRYRLVWELAAGADGETGPAITITIPSDGWTSYAQFAADKNYGAVVGPSFVLWKITNRYTDACVHEAVLSPAPGPGIDALLQALANQPGLTAGPLTPVTVDGYTGKYVDLTVATRIGTCTGGFDPWLEKQVEADNEVLRVYALDVRGFRFTFFLRIPPATTPADRAALLSLVDSLDIQP